MHALRVSTLVFLVIATSHPAPAQESRPERLPPGFGEKTASVDGVKINYKIGGSGPVVVLLHGYTQTSHMWLPLMPLLATTHTVIAPDLRGVGESANARAGYDKKTMATDIRELVRQLGLRPAGGGRRARHRPDGRLRLRGAVPRRGRASVVLMDAFLPGIGDWKNVWLMRDLWHFHFYGETPLALVKGRERTYFEHFWNDFAADQNRSVPEADRQLYAAAYAQRRRHARRLRSLPELRAGREGLRRSSRPPSSDMPFLVLTGEKASGTFLIEQTKLVATDVSGIVVKGSGHWLMEEAPDQVIPELTSFLAK